MKVMYWDSHSHWSQIQPADQSHSASDLQGKDLQCPWMGLHLALIGWSSAPASISIYNHDVGKTLLDAGMILGDVTQSVPSVTHLTHEHHKIRCSETDIHSIGRKNSSEPGENYIEKINWKHFEEKLRLDVGFVKSV